MIVKLYALFNKFKTDRKWLTLKNKTNTGYLKLIFSGQSVVKLLKIWNPRSDLIWNFQSLLGFNCRRVPPFWNGSGRTWHHNTRRSGSDTSPRPPWHGSGNHDHSRAVGSRPVLDCRGCRGDPLCPAHLACTENMFCGVKMYYF